MLASAALALPVFAHAATETEAPAAGQPSQLQEVVVTARRVEENIQNVPVAVTAVNATALKEAVVRNPYDLQQLVPGLTVTSTFFGHDQLNYTIRGQSGDTQTVAIYFNDVYAVDQNGTGIPYYDMASVQVLKGPQGTLFGATATGGAVLYGFQQPTDQLSAYVSGGAGNLGFGNFNGAVNLPLTHWASLRFSGFTERRDGYTHTTSGRTLDNENVYAYRMQLKLKPTDNLQSLFMYDSYRWDQSGDSTILVGVAPCGSKTATGSPIIVSCPGFFPTLPQVLAQQQAFGPRLANLNGAHFFRATENIFSNTTTFDVTSHLRLKNMVGYRYVDRAIETEDGTPFAVIEADAFPTVHFAGLTLTGGSQLSATRTWTEEFQVQGKDLAGGAVDFTVGYFYANEALVPYPGGLISSFEQFIGAPGAFGGAISYNQSTENDVTNAVYGHVDIKLTPISDTLTLSGGYRHNMFDQKNRQSIALQYIPAFPAGSSCRVGTTANGCQNSIAPYSENGDAWDITLNWKARPDLLLYVSHKHGYRHGMRQDLAALPDSVKLVKPEKVEDTELGLKSDFTVMNAPVRVDGDVFYQDYQDIQRSAPAVCVANSQFVSCSTPGSTAANFSVNAAKARIFGGEIGVDVRPIEGLTLSTFYAYTNARFTSFNALFSEGQNLAGLKFANVPEHNLGVSGRYEFATSIGRPYIDVNYNWRSSTFQNDTNTAVARVGAYGILNMSLGINGLANKPIDAYFWVNNLTDLTRTLTVIDVVSSAGIAYAKYTPPRMFGVTATLHFGSGAHW